MGIAVNESVNKLSSQMQDIMRQLDKDEENIELQRRLGQVTEEIKVQNGVLLQEYYDKLSDAEAEMPDNIDKVSNFKKTIKNLRQTYEELKLGYREADKLLRDYREVKKDMREMIQTLSEALKKRA